MYWQNMSCLCTPVLSSCWTLRQRWGECSNAQGVQSLRYTWQRVWRHDKAKRNLLITPPSQASSSSLHVSLSSCLAHTHRILLPRSLVHLPALLEECRVSAMRQHPTNGLRWERLGSVVGTLLPSLLFVPGNQRCPREGPPAARWLNEHQTKTLTNRWVTRVNVGFSPVYSFSPPPIISSFMVGTLLYILAGLKKKKKGASERNKTVKVWELFLVPFFSFQVLLSVLTLLT